MPCYVHKGKQKLVGSRFSKKNLLAFVFTWVCSVWTAYVSIIKVLKSLTCQLI